MPALKSDSYRSPECGREVPPAYREARERRIALLSAYYAWRDSTGKIEAMKIKITPRHLLKKGRPKGKRKVVEIPFRRVCGICQKPVKRKDLARRHIGRIKPEDGSGPICKICYAIREDENV